MPRKLAIAFNILNSLIFGVIILSSLVGLYDTEHLTLTKIMLFQRHSSILACNWKGILLYKYNSQAQ